MTQVDVLKTQRICSTDRSVQLSLIRVAACLGIIILHTVFAANEYFIDSVTAAENLFSRIIENNMMWAVPLFLMVTGALQLSPSKELTWKKLYCKYINRVLGALVIFSVLFRIFDIIMDGETFSLYSLAAVAFREFLTGRGWGHLWYLYLLIGIYILLPFYRMIARQCSDRELVYLACIYFVFTSVIPAIESAGINIAFYISESLVYPLYLFLGYMLHDRRIRISRMLAILLILASTAGILGLDVMKYAHGINVPEVFFGYSSPLVIIQSIGLFALADGIPEERLSGIKKPMILTVDRYTFGIYLIHMMFVRLLFKYLRLNPYDGAAALILTLCVLGFFMLSLASAQILKRIPVFRKVL